MVSVAVAVSPRAAMWGSMQPIQGDPQCKFVTAAISALESIDTSSPVRLKRADSPLPPRKGCLAHRARSLPPRCGGQRLVGRGGCAASAPRVAQHLPEGQWDHSSRRSQERAFESHAGAPPVLEDHLYKRVHTRSRLQTSYP